MSLRALLSAGMLVTAGIMASRVLGFLREALIAGKYGTGADASMAIGLLIIPDYITVMLIGGGLSAVLLPAFSVRNEAEQLALFWQSMLLSVAVFSILALLVYSQSSVIIGTLHTTPEIVSSDALFWSLFSMPFAGAGGVINAWLQYHGRFAVPAFANALFNLVVVLTLWLAPSGFTVLGLGIFAAGLARLVLFATGFLRTEYTFISRQPWQLSRKLLAHYATTVGNSFFLMLPQYAPYLLITLLAGQLAVFNYAFKLLLLPAMLMNTFIGVVLLPRFVHLRKEGRDLAEYARSLRVAILLTVSVTLCMSLAAWHIVSLCFGHGAMTGENIQKVTDVFLIGIWALPGMVTGYLFQQIFYSHEKPGVAFKASITQAIVCVPLIWVAQQHYQETGTMLACVIVQTLPIVYSSYMLQSHGILPVSMQWKGCAITLGTALLAFVLPAWLFQMTSFSPLAGLIYAVLTGMIILATGFLADRETRSVMLARLRRA